MFRSTNSTDCSMFQGPPSTGGQLSTPSTGGVPTGTLDDVFVVLFTIGYHVLLVANIATSTVPGGPLPFQLSWLKPFCLTCLTGLAWLFFYRFFAGWWSRSRLVLS